MKIIIFFSSRVRDQIDWKFMFGGLKLSFAESTETENIFGDPSSSSSPSRVFRRRRRGGGPSLEWLRRRRRWARRASRLQRVRPARTSGGSPAWSSATRNSNSFCQTHLPRSDSVLLQTRSSSSPARTDHPHCSGRRRSGQSPASLTPLASSSRTPWIRVGSSATRFKERCY